MKAVVSIIFSSVLMCLSFTFSVNGTEQDILPDKSVYHIESTWQDQSATKFNIKDLQGKVRLVAFIYTYCEHTCPVIITRIKSILNELPPQLLAKTAVTLVSLDPERDTVERVKIYMQEHHLDNQGWQILVGDPDDVLSLAALFDVRYKPMGESDIEHANTISLLDQNGVIQEQLKGLRQDSKQLVERLIELTQLPDLQN